MVPSPSKPDTSTKEIVATANGTTAHEQRDDEQRAVRETGDS
jgi:hypothetical protein